MSTYIHLIDYAGNTRIVNVSQISAVNVTATADYIYFIEGEESFSSTITSNAERAHLLDILSFSQFYDARVNNLGWILNLAWIKEVDYTPETSTQIEEALVHYTLDGKTFTFIGGQVPPFIAALEAYVGNAGGEGGTGGSGAKGNTGNTGPIGATGLAGRTGATGLPGTPGAAGATGATGSTSLATRTISGTLGANPNTTVVLNAIGLQSDLNNVTVTFTGNNTFTISNVVNLKLTGMNTYYDAGVNTSTDLYILYPEINGATTLATSSFPSFYYFNAVGVIQGLTNITIANSSGIMSLHKASIVGSASIYSHIQF